MNIKFIIYFLVLAISTLNARANYNQLDEFDDLELESLDYPKKSSQNISKNKQKLILFDDNLYLLEDDFDFGTDEIELQKLELDSEDMETAREYEKFLNVFFENSPRAGSPMSGYQNMNSAGPSARSGRNTKFKPSTSTRNRLSVPGNYPKTKGKYGFGVSTILGASIPMGQNLKSNFSSGSNFGVHIETPISYNIGNKEARFGADLYLSSMSAINSGGSSYNLGNINGTISLFLSKSLELKTGIGITPSSIGDYAKTLFSLPIDVNYYLPLKIGGFGLALNLHAQETLGIPTDVGTEDTKATSEFINLGFFITTPLVF
tara:strand:+ start:536 stop:1492 length:957 start_codon:yes stop_codon:yes gene_type:complete